MWLLCSDEFFTFFLIKGIITNQELPKDESKADAVDRDVHIKLTKTDFFFKSQIKEKLK